MTEAFPTAAQLAEAVEEFLRDELLPALDGRLKFQTLVAANVMAILRRELIDGPAGAAAHQERLASLGVADDAALVAAIRGGEMDDRIAEVIATLRPSVEAAVKIANPKHLR
ncbi:MAG TPA: DUF6285 domain-containing protein [Mycobacteriales bacterium]|nr:DUF6285 domain-containing protein [Mycobacteriales bacterium]